MQHEIFSPSIDTKNCMKYFNPKDANLIDFYQRSFDLYNLNLNFLIFDHCSCFRHDHVPTKFHYNGLCRTSQWTHANYFEHERTITAKNMGILKYHQTSLISYERGWPLACLEDLIKPNQASIHHHDHGAR
jgi:hypothetical protein